MSLLTPEPETIADQEQRCETHPEMSVDPSLESRIQALFVDTLNIEVARNDTDLVESGMIDSLALVELLFALEREFGISLPLDSLEIESFRSITRIGELVASVAAESTG